MKKTQTIKTAMIIVLIMVMNLGFGQSDYLKITKSDTKNDFIKYPPGTAFQLIDKNNVIVFSETSTTKSFLITKPLTLEVNPSYKDGTDTYYLSEGKIEVNSNADYFKVIEKHKKKNNSNKDYEAYQYDKDGFTYGLSMEKTVTNQYQIQNNLMLHSNLIMA